jgi:alpha-L-arabinofuranosidase
MKLWQENYLPNRLQFEGATGGLDCVATGDGKAGVMALKLVNPAAAAVPVAVTIKSDAPIRSAALQWVRADALSEQNSLETPDNIQAEPGPLRRSGRVVEWTMPAWSVGVLRIEFSDPTN